jgi:hypothetical protein
MKSKKKPKKKRKNNSEIYDFMPKRATQELNYETRGISVSDDLRAPTARRQWHTLPFFFFSFFYFFLGAEKVGGRSSPVKSILVPFLSFADPLSPDSTFFPYPVPWTKISNQN